MYTNPLINEENNRDPDENNCSRGFLHATPPTLVKRKDGGHIFKYNT